VRLLLGGAMSDTYRA